MNSDTCSLRSLAVLRGGGGARRGEMSAREIRPAQKLSIFELCVRQRTQNSDWLKLKLIDYSNVLTFDDKLAIRKL